jgi:hypothetical protein
MFKEEVTCLGVTAKSGYLFVLERLQSTRVHGENAAMVNRLGRMVQFMALEIKP